MYTTGFSQLTNLDISTFLKRDFNDNEKEIVNNLITEIESQLCEECNREFDYLTEYNEVFNSPAIRITPKNMPIKEVVSITSDGVEITDYEIYNYYIEFEEIKSKPIELTYEIEKFWGKNIILLLKKWVAYEFLNSENGGVFLSSMGFSEVSQVFDVNSFLKEKEKVIFKYKILDF